MAPHPTTHPNTYVHVFCNQQVKKRCLMTRFWLILRFLKYKGGMSIFVHFDHFRSTLRHSCTLWAPPRGLLMLLSCSTTLTPCPNFWQARFDDSLEIWYTSTHGDRWRFVRQSGIPLLQKRQNDQLHRTSNRFYPSVGRSLGWSAKLELKTSIK